MAGTYHMPCSFQKPRLMNAHCALSAQHIHKFAYSDRYSDPYIFWYRNLMIYIHTYIVHIYI